MVHIEHDDIDKWGEVISHDDLGFIIHFVLQ